MKYTTFRNIAVIAGLVLGAGTCYLIGSSIGGDEEPERANPVSPYGAGGLSPQVAQARPSPEQILLAFERPAVGDKKKDVFPGSGVKINFYADNGSPRWNRAKIDFDNDDEQYTITQFWNGSAFVAEGDLAASPGVAPAQPAAEQGGLRPMDRMVLDLLKKPASGDKIKDAFPRETFKVNLYRDAGHTSWNRLKIDLDRDEKWDEKWDLENGQPTKRHVSSVDDDKTYDQEFRWLGGKWEVKKK